MDDKIVSFHGLTIKASELLQQKSRVKSHAPLEWTRVEVPTPEDIWSIDFSANRLNKWLLKNVEGKFAHYIGYDSVTLRIRAVIFFEYDYSAVLFKLMDGENRWFKDEEDI